MDKLTSVAIYARVSTEEQAEYGYSIGAQLDTLRNYCALNNKNTWEYADRRIVSGKGSNRQDAERSS